MACQIPTHILLVLTRIDNKDNTRDNNDNKIDNNDNTIDNKDNTIDNKDNNESNDNTMMTNQKRDKPSHRYTGHSLLR